MSLDFAAVLRMAMYVGPAGTGKTERIVNEALACRANGAAQSALVLCASPQAVQTMRSRLRDKARADEAAPALSDAAFALSRGEGGGSPSADGGDTRMRSPLNGIRVATPREIGLEILGTSHAKAFTGRQPRMLLPYEEEFLICDLMTSGTKEKRTREMFKFFCRNWSEARDDSEWLMEGEESFMHAQALRFLRLYQGMCDVEITAFAARYLDAFPEKRERTGYDCVFVDGFQHLSRSSQLLASRLALQSLTVSADPDDTCPAFERFPYLEGLAELAEKNPNAETVALRECKRGANAARIAEKLLGDFEKYQSQDEECGGAFEGRTYETPEEERAAVVSLVQEAVRSGMDPGDIAVLTAHDAWRKSLCREIEGAGIACASRQDAKALRVSVTEPSGNAVARLVALLALASDRENAAAWRCACGFATPLAESQGFMLVYDYADEHGIGLVEALGNLDAARSAASSRDGEGSPPAPCKTLLARYREISALLDDCAGLRGRELLEALAAYLAGCTVHIPDAALQLVSPVRETSTAQEMLCNVFERCCFPSVQRCRLSRDAWVEGEAESPAEPAAMHPSCGGEGDLSWPQAVCVADVRQVDGLNPRLLLFAGFVDGFILPLRYFDKTAIVEKDALKIRREWERILYAALGKSSGDTVITCFRTASVEEADALRLRVERIRVERGMRVCKIAASAYRSVLQPFASSPSSTSLQTGRAGR